VATSILYCRASQSGGQTTFTPSGIKVVPKRRQLLLFGYKFANNSMDNMMTEHSGCPIRVGQKWIATQWFRENVTEDHPWNDMENWGM
jgi:prolyl 4-hydroxylase